jgi:hypothetical protein
MKRPGKSSSQDQSEEGRVSDAQRALLLVLIAQAELATKPPPAAEVTPRTKAILAKLEEPVAMVFPKKVTLDEALQHIQRATQPASQEAGMPLPPPDEGGSLAAVSEAGRRFGAPGRRRPRRRPGEHRGIPPIVPWIRASEPSPIGVESTRARSRMDGVNTHRKP